MVNTICLSCDEIERAAELVKKGHVIAFPTETVYGLGAPIFNPQAIAQIFTLKGRPSDNPLIVHISDLSQVKQIAIDIPSSFYTLAHRFFPGPCTVVLKKHPRVPSIVSAGMDTIAIRMPDHAIARALITSVGEPLAAPSANLSGKPSATRLEHVLEDFQGHIAAVIDGGQTQLGIESTVISLLHEPPILLRPGAVTRELLEETFGYSIIEAGSYAPEKAISPGMKYRHYAPSTPIRVFRSFDAFLEAAKTEERPMLLTRYSLFSPPRGDHFQLSAKELYALFRYADVQKYSSILILGDEVLLSDCALKNRLLKACDVQE